MGQKIDLKHLGVIEDATTYPMPLFMQTSGLGKHALTGARRQGLKVVRLGGRVFIRGRDFNEFLASLSPTEGGER